MLRNRKDIKIDFISIEYLIMIFSVYFIEKIPLIIPLKYEIEKEKVIFIIIISLCFYELGSFLRKRTYLKHRIYFRRIIKVYNSSLVPITLLIFFIFFLYAITLFIEKGIPLFEMSAGSSIIKTDLSIGAKGRTRIIDNFLPMLSLYLFSYSEYIRNTRRNRFASYIAIFLSYLLLLFRAFKGNIIWFSFGLLFMKYIFQKNINWIKIFIVFIMICFTIVSVYLITEGTDFLLSVVYVFDRVAVYSWEGLNFIVSEDVNPDYRQQFRILLGDKQIDSPDISLAKEFYNTTEPTIGIVPTLVGTFYRNGETLIVMLGFLLFGIISKNIRMNLFLEKSIEKGIVNYYLYITFFKLFLVGNVANTLRGELLSIFIMFIYFKLIRKVKV